MVLDMTTIQIESTEVYKPHRNWWTVHTPTVSTSISSSTHFINGVPTSSFTVILDNVATSNTSFTNFESGNVISELSSIGTITVFANSGSIFIANETLSTPKTPRATQLTGPLSDEIDGMIRRGELEKQAVELFASEPQLFYYTGDLYARLKQEIEASRLTAEYQIKVSRNPESKRTDIVLDCRVANLPYSELLILWKRLSLRLFADMPKNIGKRIFLIMGPPLHVRPE